MCYIKKYFTIAWWRCHERIGRLHTKQEEGRADGDKEEEEAQADSHGADADDDEEDDDNEEEEEDDDDDDEEEEDDDDNEDEEEEEEDDDDEEEEEQTGSDHKKGIPITRDVDNKPEEITTDPISTKKASSAFGYSKRSTRKQYYYATR